MRRREFITLLGGAAASSACWPFAARAQQQAAGRLPLVAVLVGQSQATSSDWVSSLPQGLQELGYVEGRDLEIVYRYADGDYTRLPALADELVKLKPQVVVSTLTTGVLAVNRAAPTIPIVGAALSDPVGFGLAASLARPGGQVTGILLTLDTLPGKQLELMLQVMPSVKRIGLLVNITNPISEIIRRNAETAAAALAVELVPVEVRVPDDLDGAFRKLADERVEIVLVQQDAMFLSERRRIAELAAAARLPSMYGGRAHVVDGGLMSYGINTRDSWRRSATYVDKILKGAAPGELPIELPTRVDLVVNLRTAKALGLAIPESFLLRADEVIE
jgi:putative tryptophan/tyrosine transport system substrate-binding protein